MPIARMNARCGTRSRPSVVIRERRRGAGMATTRTRFGCEKAGAFAGAGYRDGISRWFDSKIANGLIEGINSLAQGAKAKARGYRSMRKLKAMVYLLAGKLDPRLPV
jgi:hypothetical protein